MKNKFILLMIVALFVFGLTGCIYEGSSNDQNKNDTTNKVTNEIHQTVVDYNSIF